MSLLEVLNNQHNEENKYFENNNSKSHTSHTFQDDQSYQMQAYQPQQMQAYGGNDYQHDQPEPAELTGGGPGEDPATAVGLNGPVYRVQDPRQRINTDRHLCVYQGGRNTNIVQIPSQGISNTSLQWNYPVPSNVIVGNEWLIQTNLTFTFAGTGYNGGQLLVFGKYDGIRDLPLHKCMTSITNKMNNQTFTVTPNQYIDAVSRYINCSDRNKYFSGTGAMPDQYFNYADANSLGSNRNPLAFYGENTRQASRGSLQYTIVSNSNTEAVVKVTIIEPLLISPLLYGREGDDHSGFPSLQNISLQIQMGDLSRLWSHANATDSGNLTGIAVNIDAAYLNLTMITPNQNQNPVLFNKPYIFNYNNLTSYLQTPVAVAAGASAVLKSGQIQLNAIPSRIYMWARRADADQDSTTSDTFAVINQVNLTWDNQNSLLSNATSNDLWRMSTKNGLQLSYPEWSTYTGGVLCVELGSDIGLLENQAPGLVGKYQFSFTLSITNPSNYAGSTTPSSVNYVLYCLPVVPGSVVFQGTTCSIKEGLFGSAQEIVDAQLAPLLTRNEANNASMFGGNFLGNLWHKVRDAGKYIAKKGLPILDKITGVVAPQYNKYVKMARQATGYGMYGRPPMHHTMVGQHSNSHHMYGRGMPDDETVGNIHVSGNYDPHRIALQPNSQMLLMDQNVPGSMTGMSQTAYPESYEDSLFKNTAAEYQSTQAMMQQEYNKAQRGEMLMKNANANNFNVHGVQPNQHFQKPYNKFTQGPLMRDPAGGCGDCVGSVKKNELRERLMNPKGGNFNSSNPVDFSNF